MVKGKQLFAVEKLGIEEEVLKLYHDKAPATKISSELAKKGVKISPLAINRWLKVVREQDIAKKELARREKYEILAINYEEKINGILEEVEDMKTRSREKGDLKIFDKMIGRLYQGIELLAKIMGDMTPKGGGDINIYIKEINKKVFNDNKGVKREIFSPDKIIDVESEIVEEGKKREEELNINEN